MSSSSILKLQVPPSIAQRVTTRQQLCCRVAMCSSALPAEPPACRTAHVQELQLQLANSAAAAFAPAQQAMSAACAAAAAAAAGAVAAGAATSMQQLLQAAPAQQQRQQQLQQQYVSTAECISRFNSSGRSRSSTKASRLLTSEITSCSSWRELQQLHSIAAPRMNAIHVSALLSSLGKLLRAAPAKQHELQALEGFLQALEHTSLQLLSTVQLPQAGPLQVIRTISSQHMLLQDSSSQGTLSLVQPQQLSTMLWGWASAGFLPGHRWWSCYWAISTPQLAAHRPQELATSLWAAAQLQQHPPAAWVAAFWAASAAALPYASPQELCMMLWGVVQLQLRPSSSWWSVLQAAAAACAQQFGPRDVAQVLWAHARLEVQPPSHLLTPLLQAASQQVRRFPGRDAAMLLWALAALGSSQSSSCCRACCTAS
ncbi:hypothetical protein COO60DRAFT_333008 [Scenedesmus sp. NREL 46B-D3]|nr:hypothetical protein COO60DRAFT_333008 [Scenedesmus sp. NREL 46B-D3]